MLTLSTLRAYCTVGVKHYNGLGNPTPNVDVSLRPAAAHERAKGRPVSCTARTRYDGVHRSGRHRRGHRSYEC
jgi:hypothetical protein